MGIPTWSSRRTALLWRRGWPFFLVPVGLGLLPAIWASDASFLGDPAQLIGNANRANLTDTWATVGLIGTLGRPYGPLATWLYQIALMTTDDAVMIVRIRAALCMVVTLLAAAWIARLARLPVVWLLGIALSPYLLLYARGLWDNTFMIPLAAVIAALALHAVLRHKLWPLPLLIPTFGAVLMLHLMSSALVAGVAIFVVGGIIPAVRAADTRERVGIGIACAILCVLQWQMSVNYLHELLGPPAIPPLHPAAASGWWFALLSPRLLTAVWIDYFFPTGYLHHGTLAGLFAIAQCVSAINFALAGLGGLLTMHGLFNCRDAITRIGTLGLLILAAQLLLNGVTHTFGQPHYYHATWIAPALLIGVSLQRLGRWRPLSAHVVGGTVAGALAICSVWIALRIHSTGGTRPNYASSLAAMTDPMKGDYGPTLSNQIAVVHTLRRLASHTDEPLDLGALPPLQRLPMTIALAALDGIDYESAPDADAPPATLHLRYLHEDDPWDGRIAVFVGDDPTPRP